jgi:hypothetical protein
VPVLLVEPKPLLVAEELLAEDELGEEGGDEPLLLDPDDVDVGGAVYCTALCRSWAM